MKENRILSNGYEEKSFSKKTRKLFREKRVKLENSTFPPLFYGAFFSASIFSLGLFAAAAAAAAVSSALQRFTLQVTTFSLTFAVFSVYNRTNTEPVHFTSQVTNFPRNLIAIPLPIIKRNISTLSLHHSAQEGHLDCVMWLAKHSGPVHSDVSIDGMTAVHAAAQEGFLDCLQFLIGSVGCGGLARDKSGNTPLHFGKSFSRCCCCCLFVLFLFHFL